MNAMNRRSCEKVSIVQNVGHVRIFSMKGILVGILLIIVDFLNPFSRKIFHERIK